MTDKNSQTEDQIFEAACKIFQEKGYSGARMQEIADEADINKSMLHYYYRSKDKLFQQVYQRQMRQFFPMVFKVLGSEMELPDKIGRLIDTYYSFLEVNPQMVQFILMEMNQNPERFKQFVREEGIRPPRQFFLQLEEEYEQGRITTKDPRQVMISIVGLILFPYTIRPLIETVFDLNQDGFMQFIQQRRDFLRTFILNALNYQEK